MPRSALNPRACHRVGRGVLILSSTIDYSVHAIPSVSYDNSNDSLRTDKPVPSEQLTMETCDLKQVGHCGYIISSMEHSAPFIEPSQVTGVRSFSTVERNSSLRPDVSASSKQNLCSNTQSHTSISKVDGYRGYRPLSLVQVQGGRVDPLQIPAYHSGIHIERNTCCSYLQPVVKHHRARTLCQSRQRSQIYSSQEARKA